MKNIFLAFIFLLAFQFHYSQEMKIKGIVKQPENERIFTLIVVNDTINKLAKIDTTDFTRRNKVNNEKKSVTFADEKGYFEIIAKPNDSIFFRFGRFYHSEKYLASDLMKHKKLIIEPKLLPCKTYVKCDQTKPSKIYGFVGKKIDVVYDNSLYCGIIPMDSKYNAVYKIEQELLDHYSDSTISFTAYDHNSMSQYLFINYDTILTFVGEYCGELIQLKYQFYPVYKTKDGRWATPVDTKKELSYKSEKYPPIYINFEESVYFDVPNLPAQQIENYRYPNKYYRTENNKAFPIMGRYVEDLIKLREEISKKEKEI